MLVHILYTGGTLGMIDTEHGLAPGADLACWLDRLLVDTDLADAVSMTTFDHLIDSSNATPKDWALIVESLWAKHDEADAFVVIQGTDTMAYTASALSFALTGFGKPVVLTGAQYPLGVVGSDAASNVTGALRAAISGQFTGVMLFFGHKLLRGNRATKISSWAFQGFESPNVAELALSGAPWQWIPQLPSGSGWASPESYARHDVAVLDLAPGITAGRLSAALDPLPEAVILRAFGAGNLPSEEPGLTTVLDRVSAAGVPLVVTSQCHQANVLLGHYDASYALVQAGAVGSGDMTLEATYAKLVFLLSQQLSPAEISRFMTTNIADELTEKRS